MVLIFVSSIPKAVAFASLIESVENENWEAEIVFPAEIYSLCPGSKVSKALPPLPPVIVITDGDELVARA